MTLFKKQYYYSLIFIDINRDEVEEEVRDFYLPVTKNSMEKHQQYFPSLDSVMEPFVNFFKSNDEKNCMATLYGYERRRGDRVDERDEEGQNLWFTILDLLLGFVGTMRKSHEFELYAYGMASDEGNLVGFCILRVMRCPLNRSIIYFQKNMLPSNSR